MSDINFRSDPWQYGFIVCAHCAKRRKVDARGKLAAMNSAYNGWENMRGSNNEMCRFVCAECSWENGFVGKGQHDPMWAKWNPRAVKEREERIEKHRNKDRENHARGKVHPETRA